MRNLLQVWLKNDEFRVFAEYLGLKQELQLKDFQAIDYKPIFSPLTVKESQVKGVKYTLDTTEKHRA